jgi:hypothetical protein
VDDDLAFPFQATEGHRVHLLSQQLSALPGPGRFAECRKGRVEVERVLRSDGDVDVVGCATGK